MATITQSRTTVENFPEQALKAVLVEWWDREIVKRSDDPFAEPNTLYDVVVEIDSLSVVNVLLDVEKVLGYEPPVTVVKRGGYRDREEMVGHMSRSIQNHHQKHRNIKPLKITASNAH